MAVTRTSCTVLYGRSSREPFFAAAAEVAICAILIRYEVSKVCRACQMLARGGLDLARPGNTVEGGGAVAGGKVDVQY